jgi:MFS family permease
MRWLRLLSHQQRQTLLMILLGLATGVEFLENIMFVFASSHIIGGIDADPRSFALVQAAYAVGSMLMILTQHWLARRFGYRYYLTGSLLLFMAGTLAAATSTGLTQMVGARFVQGVGGGALFTSCRILVNMMFSQTDRCGLRASSCSASSALRRWAPPSPRSWSIEVSGRTSSMACCRLRHLPR